jgi:hypothetical protein
VPWVLVTSAFVLGVALGAAALAGVWQTTSDRSVSKDPALLLANRHLRDARADSAALGTRLRHTKRDLASTLQDKRQLKVELRRALDEAAVASRQAASDRSTAQTLRHRASTLMSYVASLDAYVKATPSEDLDGGYLRSQLTYLSQAADRLRTP